jgi:hypothetical protein
LAFQSLTCSLQKKNKDKKKSREIDLNFTTLINHAYIIYIFLLVAHEKISRKKLNVFQSTRKVDLALALVDFCQPA